MAWLVLHLLFVLFSHFLASQKALEVMLSLIQWVSELALALTWLMWLVSDDTDDDDEGEDDDEDDEDDEDFSNDERF